MSTYRPTSLTIDVNAIAGNARQVRRALGGKARMMAVVKANAYGHGMIPVARRLVKEGADALAVATVDEGVLLRESGVRAPILVLGGSPVQAASTAVQMHISQAVFDREMLFALQAEAEKLGSVAHAHLKIDTGMSRVGVRGDHALQRLLDDWAECRNVKMEGAFTHFAAADTDPDFTRSQNEALIHALELVRRAGFRPVVHAAASSGIIAGEQYYHDMVRPGVALYGAAVADQLEGLQPAQKLSTYPVRLQWIEPGDTVSYGRAFCAERPTRVMTLPIGYADGYRRILGGRAQALVEGTRVPVIGRVCMDQIMLDVTDVPGTGMDSEVVLLGRQGEECITPDEMAAWAETIPYEIMLGFSPRVVRKVIES